MLIFPLTSRVCVFFLNFIIVILRLIITSLECFVVFKHQEIIIIFRKYKEKATIYVLIGVLYQKRLTPCVSYNRKKKFKQEKDYDGACGVFRKDMVQVVVTPTLQCSSKYGDGIINNHNNNLQRHSTMEKIIIIKHLCDKLYDRETSPSQVNLQLSFFLMKRHLTRILRKIAND